MQKPIATFKDYDVYKRTFEAKKFPKDSAERSILNESSITSEYMTSYKYAVVGPQVSASCIDKEKAVEMAKKFAGVK